MKESDSIVGIIYGELRSVPITMFLVFILYFGMMYLWHDHVSTQDLQTIRAEMVVLNSGLEDLQITLIRDHADTNLRRIEAEIFNLTQRVNDEKSHGRVVDPLYYQRINDLTAQLEQNKSEVAEQISIAERKRARLNQ